MAAVALVGLMAACSSSAAPPPSVPSSTLADPVRPPVAGRSTPDLEAPPRSSPRRPSLPVSTAPPLAEIAPVPAPEVHIPVSVATGSRASGGDPVDAPVMATETSTEAPAEDDAPSTTAPPVLVPADPPPFPGPPDTP